MDSGRRTCGCDQPAVGGACKGSDSALDLAGVAQPDRSKLDADGRRGGLDRTELARPRGDPLITQNPDPPYARGNLYQQLQPFGTEGIFELAEAGGTGAVVAAQLAIDDVGGKVRGQSVVLLGPDHQNKTDVGVSLARQVAEVHGGTITIAPFSLTAS